MTSSFPLIYIVGNGRSGSTLLDQLLGLNETAVSLGEVQILPRLLGLENAACGCGSQVEECEFWQELTTRWHPSGDFGVDYFASERGIGRSIRLRELISLASGVRNVSSEPRVDEYAKETSKLILAAREASAEISGSIPAWTIDSSKDVYRLYWLLRSDLINVRAIHLVKDPRAYVYSIYRRQEQVSTLDIYRWSLRWVWVNALITYVVSLFPSSRSMLLQYRQLAGNTEGALVDIFDWLQLPGSVQDIIKGFRAVPTHAVGGNEMRWQGTDIFLDESWTKSLPRSYEQIVWRIAGPTAEGLGFSRIYSN